MKTISKLEYSGEWKRRKWRRRTLVYPEARRVRPTFPLAMIATFLAPLASPLHAQTPAPQPDPTHTTLFLHGRIYTNDPAHPWASALAVRDGKIICAGDISTVMLECSGGDNTETVQLAN